MKEQALVLRCERHGETVIIRTFKVERVRVVLLATLITLKYGALIGSLELSDELVHLVPANLVDRVRAHNADC